MNYQYLHYYFIGYTVTKVKPVRGYPPDAANTVQTDLFEQSTSTLSRFLCCIVFIITHIVLRFEDVHLSHQTFVTERCFLVTTDGCFPYDCQDCDIKF